MSVTAPTRIDTLGKLSQTLRRQLDDIGMTIRGLRTRKPEDRGQRLQELQVQRRAKLQEYYEVTEELERLIYLPTEA